MANRFNELSEEIKKQIVAELDVLGFNGADKDKVVLYSGSKMAPSSFFKSIGFPECLSSELFKEIAVPLALDRASFISQVGALLLQQTVERKKIAVLENPDASINEGILELASSCVFAIYDSGEVGKTIESSIVAVHKVTHELVFVPRPEMLLYVLGTSPKEMLKTGLPILVKEFNPYTLARTFTKTLHGSSVLMLNTYVAPRWQTAVKDNPGKFGGIVKRVIMHLFPIEEDREYVLDWLHHAIFGRNQTILICAGAKGIGKNVIFEEVLSHLVGRPYLKKATQATLSQKFNPEFEESKVVLFDEVITQGTEEKSTLKRLANDLISVERKGQDSKTVKNFSSMVVLTNDTGKLGLDTSERRMSCPHMTSVKLKTTVPDKEIGRFKAALDVEEQWAMEEIANFGYFLLYRKPKHRPEEALMGDYFYDLCELALPVWMTTLKSLVAEGNYVDGQIITRRDILEYLGDEEHHSKVPERMSTFKDAIESFSYRGLHKIGDVDYFRDAKKYRSVPGIKLNGAYIEAVKKESVRVKEMTEKLEKRTEDIKRGRDKAAVLYEIEEHNKKALLEEQNVEDLL